MDNHNFTRAQFIFFLEGPVVYGNQDMLLKCDVVIRADIYSFGLNLECERV